MFFVLSACEETKQDRVKDPNCFLDYRTWQALPSFFFFFLVVVVVVVVCVVLSVQLEITV